jgi:hypothetical protein
MDFITIFQFILEFIDIIDVSKLDCAITNKKYREQFLCILKDIPIHFDYATFLDYGYSIYPIKSLFRYISQRDIYLNLNNTGYINDVISLSRYLNKSTNLTKLKLCKDSILMICIPTILKNNKHLKSINIIDSIDDFNAIKYILKEFKYDTVSIKQNPIYSFDITITYYEIQCVLNCDNGNITIIFSVKSPSLFVWQLMFDNFNSRQLIIDCTTIFCHDFYNNKICNLDFSNTQLTEITISNKVDYSVIPKLFTMCKKINYYLYSNNYNNNRHINYITGLKKHCNIESTYNIFSGIVLVLTPKTISL